MEAKINHSGVNYNLAVEGRLGTTASPAFEDAIKPLYEVRDLNLTVDVAGLTYISSCGLRCFITLLKKVKANSGKMVITNMNNDIMEVFEMTGFSNLFEIR